MKTPEPNSCAFCGVPRRDHGTRYWSVEWFADELRYRLVGALAGNDRRHQWTEPWDELRLRRMKARRAAR